MNKKLPNVFKNTFTKPINNNLQSYNTKENLIDNLNNQINPNIQQIMINKKINELFNSESFVYKVKAIITTKSGDKEYTLIARNNNTLLTLNNVSINIDEILDIKKA